MFWYNLTLFKLTYWWNNLIKQNGWKISLCGVVMILADMLNVTMALYINASVLTVSYEHLWRLFKWAMLSYSICNIHILVSRMKKKNWELWTLMFLFLQCDINAHSSVLLLFSWRTSILASCTSKEFWIHELNKSCSTRSGKLVFNYQRVFLNISKYCVSRYLKMLYLEKFLLTTSLKALSHPRYLSLDRSGSSCTCNSFFVYLYHHLLKENRIISAAKFLKYFWFVCICSYIFFTFDSFAVGRGQGSIYHLVSFQIRQWGF